jgi:hypothetical protein
MKGIGPGHLTRERDGWDPGTTDAHSSMAIGRASEDGSSTIIVRTGTAKEITGSGSVTEIVTEATITIEIATATKTI